MQDDVVLGQRVICDTLDIEHGRTGTVHDARVDPSGELRAWVVFDHGNGLKEPGRELRPEEWFPRDAWVPTRALVPYPEKT